MKTLWILIWLGVHITALPFYQTLKGSSEPVREYDNAVTLLSRKGKPRSLSTSLSSSMKRNFFSETSPDKPFIIKHHTYCHNLEPSIIENLRSESLREHFWEHSLGKNIDPLSSSFSAGFDSTDSENEKEVFVRNGELHILHVPKEHLINLDDLKAHIDLLSAHETPQFLKTNLELNKHFDSFEVNLEEPSQISGHIVKPESQGYVLKSTLNKSNMGHSHHIWRKPIFNQLSTANQHEEKLSVPHFESHPLENDEGKSTYDTIGAVDSYGSPIKHTEENYHSSFVHSPSESQFEHDGFIIQEVNSDSGTSFPSIMGTRHQNHRYR